MAVVTVYASHSRSCSKSGEKNSGQYKRCRCPFWLQWNKNNELFKKSTMTRSREIATKTARRLEQELELESLGVEPIKKAEHITIESAADCIWATWLRGIYYQKGGRA
jgi:hypothetical protein